MKNLMAPRSVRWPVVLALLLMGAAPVVLADSGPDHRVRQDRPVKLGTSGGNINGFLRGGAFCTSGTLGSLVQDNGGVQYILSNNHVLARTNNASNGEDINQPGLVDVGCRKIAADVVADLSAFELILFKKKGSTPLNTVDAAIAQVRPGKVHTGGSILDIGTLSSNTAEDKVGCPVQKSGRTTGLTQGTISAVDVTIDVKYDAGTARFVHQFLVEDGSFSAGGDSGSTIVRDGSSPRAVGLLFAGSSDFTVGNRIGEVQSAFGVTPVGSGDGTTGNCPDPVAPTGGASAAKGRHEEALMRVPGVVGVGVGAGPAIEVYLARESAEARRHIPARLENVPVRILVTGEFHAR